MAAVRSSFDYSFKGTFFGVKINRQGPNFKRVIQGALPTGKQFLDDMSKLLRHRMESRVPILKENFKNGAPGAIGTIQFESSSHGSHRPHKDIPNPLSLIIDHGFKYRVHGRLGEMKLDVTVYNTRKRQINFHKKMGKTPRVSKVLERFDDTCLPYLKAGHMDKISQYWMANTKRAFNRDLNKYIRDKNQAFLDAQDKTKAGS
tara:strand:+ start:902 stop:1510 length:609 start_codon:yes stop_codon:yes gene_type:complete